MLLSILFSNIELHKMEAWPNNYHDCVYKQKNTLQEENIDQGSSNTKHSTET